MSCAIFLVLKILGGLPMSKILKKRIIPILSLVAVGILVFSSCADRQAFAKEDKLADFFNKKDVTIAVTDSGLGGLSILGDAVERMKKGNIIYESLINQAKVGSFRVASLHSFAPPCSTLADGTDKNVKRD